MSSPHALYLQSDELLRGIHGRLRGVLTVPRLDDTHKNPRKRPRNTPSFHIPKHGPRRRIRKAEGGGKPEKEAGEEEKEKEKEKEKRKERGISKWLFAAKEERDIQAGPRDGRLVREDLFEADTKAAGVVRGELLDEGGEKVDWLSVSELKV